MFQNKRLWLVLLLVIIGFYVIVLNQNHNHKNKNEGKTNTSEEINENNYNNHDEEKAILMTAKNLNITCSNSSNSELMEIFDFEGFDNVNGSDKYIVPNIVHLIYLRVTTINFMQMVTIYSIFLNQNPDKIYIHCDNCSFHGQYWNQLMATKCLKEKIEFHRVPTHATIFGTKFKWIQHRSDVIRAMVLMTYGGIYLDNDVYVVNSLDKYRKYEMTIGWEVENSIIGNQVFIAHPQARFLKAYLDQYRYGYSPNLWYWNAGHFPAKLLTEYRYLAHLVPTNLGVHVEENFYYLYKVYWHEWRKMDTIHLLINHRWYSDVFSPIVHFDENNFHGYNRTIGEMIRNVIKRVVPYLNQNIVNLR